MTAPLPLGRVVATPGALKLLMEVIPSSCWPATPRAIGESCAPSTAARTR